MSSPVVRLVTSAATASRNFPRPGLEIEWFAGCVKFVPQANIASDLVRRLEGGGQPRELGRHDDQFSSLPGRGLHGDLLVRRAAPVMIDQPPIFCCLRLATPASLQRRRWVVEYVFVTIEIQSAGNAVGVAVKTG